MHIMAFDIISYVLGFVTGAIVSLAVGRTRYRAIQDEAREQIDTLERRVEDLLTQVRSKTGKVIRRTKK